MSTNPNGLACAILKCVGVDPSTVQSFTLTMGVGDVPRLTLQRAVFNYDLKEMEHFSEVWAPVTE